MEIIATTSTNDDKPFEQGEMILFAGDPYYVHENFGDSGSVKEHPEDTTSYAFRWTYQGEKCVRAAVV